MAFENQADPSDVLVYPLQSYLINGVFTNFSYAGFINSYDTL
jgi:hypothetical protein